MEKLELQKNCERSPQRHRDRSSCCKKPAIRADLYQQQIYSHICILKK